MGPISLIRPAGYGTLRHIYTKTKWPWVASIDAKIDARNLRGRWDVDPSYRQVRSACTANSGGGQGKDG